MFSYELKMLPNEYVEILNYITAQIRGNIFSLLIDEFTDVSGKEQMTILSKYFSNLGFIIELLLGV